nr:hypothetical protein GCM10020093_110270 [Planobispora longispora]
MTVQSAGCSKATGTAAEPRWGSHAPSPPRRTTASTVTSVTISAIAAPAPMSTPRLPRPEALARVAEPVVSQGCRAWWDC